jgi:hypothetical protein
LLRNGTLWLGTLWLGTLWLETLWLGTLWLGTLWLGFILWFGIAVVIMIMIIMCSPMNRKIKCGLVQLNEYETVLYFLLLSKNLTWDCLLISVDLPVLPFFA